MPRIAEFFGIVIQIYHQEHRPQHFHATYGGDSATVRIEPIEVLEGHLPPRQLRLVLEWAGLRQHEKTRNWERARDKDTLGPIEPLR